MYGRGGYSDYDLHRHTSVSDGALDPVEVVQRAAAQGVHVMALTDIDEPGGLGAARKAAREDGLTVMAGV